MNIAVFGGTFDPIHSGHMMVADVVSSRLDAQVIFIPAGQPWLKSERRLASVEDRLEMVRRAIHGNRYYSLSTAETERSGPSYSVDTMRWLKRQIAPCDELYFVIGWDNLLSLPHWRDPETLISLCRIVAVPRIGYDAPNKATLEKLLNGLSEKVVLLDEPEIDISSSAIRERIQHGLPLDNLLPQAVESYIKEQNLYLE
ncbi:MAG: nicotinate-nucleotide adenylyltransferase [Dehalococcoidia bacterium]|nr:nicotinate-nucleotide adenylyltransferase [Dehalococcoidia bacterium]